MSSGCPFGWHMTPALPIPGGVSFEHLVKGVSARLLHHEVTNSDLCNHLVKRYLDTMQVFFSVSNFHPSFLLPTPA